MIIMVILIVFWILNVTGYSLSSITNLTMDNGTKAYILHFYNDLVLCVILPLVTLYSAPTVRKSLENTWLFKCLANLKQQNKRS